VQTDGHTTLCHLTNLSNAKIPLLLSTNDLSTEGTKKHGRENPVLFRVFRVFRGPSLLYSCLPSWFPIQERGSQQYRSKLGTSTSVHKYRQHPSKVIFCRKWTRINANRSQSIWDHRRFLDPFACICVDLRQTLSFTDQAQYRPLNVAGNWEHLY